ncbi:MAG: hypothetical protein AAB738_04085 [Patescibacteria group bacterium]
MKYDFYFHNDFDGRASAAVFWDFLKKRGDEVGDFYSMDHFMAPEWDGLVRKSINPVVIFDFYFHPKAAFFFDHHRTTFVKRSWQKSFRPNKYRYLDFSYKSCASLVLATLKKHFQYHPPRHIVELARWADFVDAAEFSSAKQTIEIKEPVLQLDAFIDATSKNDSLAWLIELMREKPIQNIIKLKKIQKVLGSVKAKIKKGLDYTQKNLQIYENVVFLDLTKTNIPRVRFAPHYFVPNLSYVLTLMRENKDFKISAGGNPWRPESCKINLGLYLKKKYGGGGHKRAAGISGIKTKEQGLKIIKELIEVLNK